MEDIYPKALFLMFLFALLVFVLLFFISAPYGKFLRKGWGKGIRSKWAWLIMEFPSPALITLLFIIYSKKSIPEIIFFVCWLSHYLDRTFIYPFSQSGRNKPYPLLLVFMAIIFNVMNGIVNGYGVFHLGDYNASWLLSWQFITGIILFVTGFYINKTADEKLRNLRTDNPAEYVIPSGWLFRYVSSPHYLGEIIEWAGWAMMTWSLPGLAFLAFSFANLFPRAIASHAWYKARFPEYPVNRKAILPFII